MKLFLDSANINEIERLVQTYAISGVTTNPSLMAKESKGAYWDKALEIAQVMEKNSESRKHLSVEAISTNPAEILDQTLKASERFEKLKLKNVELFFKVPITLENLKVISTLSGLDVSVNATACMTAAQAKIAGDAGARIVSFFYNRIRDGGGSPEEVLSSYRSLRNSSLCYPNIICGSIRKVEDVLQAWEFGSDIVTASAKIIEEMTKHPQTDKAIEQFQKDIDSWLS